MFKLAITDQYGLTVDEDRSAAAVALIDISMLKNETVDSFIDRFNGLRRRSVDQCPPVSVLINKFLSALPANLQDKVTVSKATLDKARKTNIDVIIDLVKDLSKELAKNKYKRVSVEQDISETNGTKRSKWASSSSASDESFTRGSSRSGASSSSGRNKKTTTEGTWCAFHKVKTHNTLDCRVASAASSAFSSASASAPAAQKHTDKTKSCFKCGVSPWTPKHLCNTARRSTPNVDNNKSPYLGAMHLENGDVTMSDPTTASHEVPLDVQAMVAQQAQLCKYNEYSQLPSHKSNSILIPVILENIKTFAVVDTGASFSIVSPEFVKSLGSSVVVFPSTGNIQLGHTQSTQKRFGHCFLDIFYNKIKFNFM